jgi:DNA-binding CsgD family transcriptional regulator
VETSIAASALQGLSKIWIRQKKWDSAAFYLEEALVLLKHSPPWTNVLQIKNFEQQIYQTKAELYRVLNKPDSANLYYTLHSNLKDSLHTVAISSNSKMSQLRIDNEKSQYAFLSLQSEKEKEEQKRNFIIVLISLVALVAIIILNRQKKLLKYKQELNLAQKAALIAEGEAVREQLQLFTRSLLEKTELLENLQKQVRDKSASKEQQEWLTELTSQTILTEEDWTRFKALFEKMYPYFFINLKETFTDITGAEQRMAALSRLHLTPAQIAAILGISVNSVHKTRQRLRLRLNLSSETSIEAYLAQL